MPELKTIRDFKINWGSGEGGIKLSDNQIKELRKNAIEHIKKIEKKIKKLNIKTGDCMHNRVGRDKIYRLYDLQGQKCAYEYFFNITEEDLR